MKKFSFLSTCIFVITFLTFQQTFASEDWSGDPSSDTTSTDSSDSSSTDTSDWSDNAPGGNADSGTSVATLITPTTTPTAIQSSTITPVSTSSGPTNHPFADLYNGLANLQGALLQSINVYWSTTNPAQNGNGCNFSNLPTSVQSIMQGEMGTYFGAVFMPGSLPLQIFRSIQKTLITYLQGITQQLTIDTYDCSTGNDFVTFIEPQLNANPGTFSGNLAYVDQIWKTTLSTINATFEKLRSSNKFNNQTINFIQSSLQTITDTYTRARYQTIITWYTKLVRELAQRHNPSAFNQGLFSYTNVPNSAALTGYSNAFIDACAQLTQYYNGLNTSGSFAVDNLSLAINQPVTLSDTVFNNAQTFFTTLQSNTFNKLGDICAYLMLLGLQRANDRIENKQIPSPKLPPVITYNTLQDVPTFLSSNQTGTLTPLAFFPGTQLPASPDFYCSQQLFNLFNGYTTGALDAFNFDTSSSAQSIFIYDSLSPLVAQTYENNGLQAPANMLQNLQSSVNAQDSTLQKLQQRVSASTPTKVSISTDPEDLISTDFKNIGDVFQELIVACNGALDAQYWYNQGNNLGTAATYSTKAKLLQNVVSAWKGACTLLASAKGQPASQSYQIYSQAGDLLYQSGSQLLTLNLLPLNTYALTLGAYVKVSSYQSLLSYYSSYYKTSLTTYNRYLQTPPAYSYANGKYNFDIVPGYEKALFMIVYYIDQALSTAMQGYQNQLSFFLSQKKNNSNYLSLIWPIQDALLLLTNFQEGITPLLLEMPCATTDNKALLCGIDYTLVQTTATTTSEKDIAAMIIKAHNQYTATYPLFKTIDAIAKKYPSSSDQYKSLQQYTSLDALFQLSANNLNFSEFFLLHQARLYTSVAQRLIEGKPFFWQQGDPVKNQGSAYALLLYGYAAAIYQNLGYTKHAETVAAMKHLLFSPQMIVSFEETITKTLREKLKEKTSQEINQMFQELNALQTVLYLSPGDKTHFNFLALLSKSITQNAPASCDTLGNCGYADWLATSPKSITNGSLQAALMYYQGYLIAEERKDVHASAFLKRAQDNFTLFITDVDKTLTAHVATLKKNSNNGTSTESYATALTNQNDITLQLNEIKKLVAIKDAYDTGLYQMNFLQTVFAPSYKNATQLSLPSNLSSTCSQFLQGGLNLPGIIGDVYLSLGNQSLAQLQATITTTISKDLTADFAAIINYYTEAKNFYGIASISDSSYQQKFLDAEHALSDAYAYQSYSSVIPLFNITIPSIKIPQKSSATLPALALETMTLDQASQRYTNNSPLFLLRQHTTTVPTLIGQSFKQNSTDSLSVLKSVAAPLYSFTLFSQVQDQTPNPTVQSYIDTYTSNYRTLCASGISIGNQTVRGSLSYTTQGSSLKMAYEPIPALPRFNAEISSAIGYYSDGSAKLYASSSSPLNYHDQLLIPSNNLAGQDLTNKALLNTYLSRAVQLTSAIDALKKDKQFLFLQKAPLDTLVKQNFYDYLPLYKKLQPLYEELIGLYIATNSFLSNYGISATACSELIAQTIIDWMQTNTLFLCGKPDITKYGALFHNLSQGSEKIQTYANQIEGGEKYSTQAAIIFTDAYGYCARAFSITPETFPTTTNPVTGTTYPDLTKTSLPNYMKWKDAGTYYVYAATILEKIISNTHTFSPAAQTTLLNKSQEYYLKAITSFLQYSTFNAAVFCSNAFQECRCSINSGGFNIVQVQSAGDPAYPVWDYPFTGLIPNVTPATYYTYPVCELDPKNGSSYIATMPSTVYQGVASMEVPLFAMSKNQSSQGQQSTYTGMYTTMQQTLLNALYYYDQSLNLVKKMLPTTKISPETKKQREAAIAKEISKWIIKAFNKNPGFYNPYTKQGPTLPTIMVLTASTDETDVSGHETRTTQFVDLVACVDLQLSLANPKQLYLHTLRYWSSRSDFYTTLLEGLTKWNTPGNYDISYNFLTDVTTMFESFFIHSYLPSININDAEYQVQEMIQNSQQDSSGSSAGYF